MTGRHEFILVGHIDSVEAGIFYRWWRDTNMNFGGSGFKKHSHELIGCGAAHNGIVHHNHLPAGQGLFKRSIFHARAHIPHALAWLDESALNVAALNNAFSVGNTRYLGV